MGGEPKALADLGGRRIIERVVDALSSVLEDLLIVTNTPELYAFLGVRMVSDVFPEGGPLGGIYTGLRAARGDAVFTVACDMPFLRAEVIRAVVSRAGEADVVVPKIRGRPETLHALYARTCLPHMEEALRAGRLKVAGFFPRVRVLQIPEEEVARIADPALCFMNVNTQVELARARRLVEAGAR